MHKGSAVLGVGIVLLIASGIGVLSYVGWGFALNENETENSTDYRLPLALIPIHYNLRMMPILEDTPGYEKFTAPGSVQITVECREVTPTIILHASTNLTIEESSIAVAENETGANLIILSITYNPALDFLEINLIRPLELGKIYNISIHFTTQIPEDRLNGMYLDYYDDPETGERNYVATTLFAPYHARRCFPNFDEPNLRAPFDIQIGRMTKYHAMSNGRLVRTDPMTGMPGWELDTFETTPSISTYIIAMIVSNFAYEEAPIESFRNVTVRAYGAPYQIERGGGKYSAQLAADLLSYFESFFRVPYPLSKAYSVALPHFFFNAMENWGLITYKEPVILYFPNETTEGDRYRINYVTSHEVGHQWFGNLVNCKFWTWVYLKEGFASYYAHFGINHTHPELEPWVQFPTTMRQVAMNFDSSEYTHPLENSPPTSAAVADIYTRIPYEKGASILRMTSKFLTEDVFHTGILKYVDNFQYSGAEQNDMFEAIQETLPQQIVPVPLKQILDTWTTQPGFPLLRVSIADPDFLLISQEKFIGDDITNPDDTWWVPVTTWPKAIPDIDEDYTDIWIPQGVTSVVLRINTAQNIIVNPRSIGYYRVVYSAELIQRIQTQLEYNHTEYPTTARSQILEDYFALAYAKGGKDVPIEITLNLTKYLNRETDWAVWKSIKGSLTQMYNVVVDTEYFENFRIYWLSKMEGAMNAKRINWPYGNSIPSKLQIELMPWFSMLGSPDFKSYSRDITTKWQNSPKENPIPVDAQSSVYCSAVSSDSDDKIWEFIYQKFIAEKSTVLRPRYARALTCTKNVSFINRLLATTSSNRTDFLKDDKILILNSIAENPVARTLTFDFIVENFEDLKSSLGTRPIINALSNLSAFMKTKSELYELEDFVSSESSILESGKESIQDAISKVKKNIKWVKELEESANNWFLLQNSKLKN